MPLSDFVPNFWGDSRFDFDNDRDDEYDSRCRVYDRDDYFKQVFTMNGVDLDNLKPETLSSQDSIELTFQFEFPFMFSASDKPEMLIYLHEFLREQEFRRLLYAAPLPKNHRISLRAPSIGHYPKLYKWEIWLIERSKLKYSIWGRDEDLYIKDNHFSHEYSVKLLEWAHWDRLDLKTSIFTPM